MHVDPWNDRVARHLGMGSKRSPVVPRTATVASRMGCTCKKHCFKTDTPARLDSQSDVRAMSAQYTYRRLVKQCRERATEKTRRACWVATNYQP